jgi:two-component system, NtrC family, sensor kinase
VAYHRRLERQLDKTGIDLDAPISPEQVRALLDRVHRAYQASDEDRYTLQRSMAVSSQEMQELYARLREERDRFHAIFESAPIGILRLDASQLVLESNGYGAGMFGYGAHELAGRRLADLLYASEHLAFDEEWPLITTGESGAWSRECRYLHKDGSVVWGFTAITTVRDADGDLGFVLATIRDITQRKRLEAELRLSQKLEAVGRLAAGIAHEINTPIQFIGDNQRYFRSAFDDLMWVCRTYRDALAQTGASPEILAGVAAVEEKADLAFLEREVPTALESSIDGVTRVATIVRAMRAFAHPDSAKPVAADLNGALSSTLTVARNELKYVAEVTTRFEELPPVTCYLGDLNQVFLNLFVNAAHAIAEASTGTGERGGQLGTLEVATRVDGEDVVVEVKDSGSGIPSEIRDHVFDPFFTTKGVGKGTGQGLSMARAVVDRHNGSLTFDSVVGQGTTFYVRLPIAGPAAAQTAPLL